MNNEPVAWMMENPQNKSAYLTFEKPTREMKISHQAIPLYTHPASLVDWSYQQGYQVGKETHPAKTLTDEEIEVLASKHLCYQIEGSEVSGVFNFARAILRKAQEK